VKAPASSPRLPIDQQRQAPSVSFWAPTRRRRMPRRSQASISILGCAGKFGASGFRFGEPLVRSVNREGAHEDDGVLLFAGLVGRSRHLGGADAPRASKPYA